MNADAAKLDLNRKAKAAMREFLLAKSWPEKVRSIARMNEASHKAKEAMRRAPEETNSLRE